MEGGEPMELFILTLGSSAANSEELKRTLFASPITRVWVFGPQAMKMAHMLDYGNKMVHVSDNPEVHITAVKLAVTFLKDMENIDTTSGPKRGMIISQRGSWEGGYGFGLWKFDELSQNPILI